MLNRLEAAARMLIRISIVLFTGVVLLLVQSVFWNDAISFLMRSMLLSVAMLAFFRPQHALLVLAGLAPLAQIWVPMLGSRMRGGEAMVLAFLAGALLNGWTLGKFRSFPSDRLQAAAAVFGAVIAASCLEQLWFSQIQLDFPEPFLRDTVAHLSRTYFTSLRGYEGVFRAMLLIEGLALLVCVSQYCRIAPAFGTQVVRMVVISAASAATLNVTFLGRELLATGDPLERLARFFTELRWSAHVGDLNAAGSFFAMGMLIAFGLALRDRARRTNWIAGCLICGLALWMTGSRTAVVAVFLVVVICAAKIAFGRSVRVLRTATFMAGALVLVAALLLQFFPASFVGGSANFGRSAEFAIYTRWLFLGTTWRMLIWQPLFGVGVGQYALWSYHFAAPELLEYHVRENAHNNFAQVAGELGVVGLIAFVLVLGAALWCRRRAHLPRNPLLTPVMTGLAAFILTWLGGHPLLVPEVAYPFWIALGVVAGLASTAPAAWKSRGLVAVIFIALLISIPMRVERKTDRLDLSRVRFGFSEQQLISSRGRFFVEDGKSPVALPLRAWGASHDRPLEVDLFVDERLTRSLTIADGKWRSERIDLQQIGARRFHQIDLHIRQPKILEDIDARSRRGIQVGAWEIMPKPNG